MIKLSSFFIFLAEYFADCINLFYQMFAQLFKYPNNPGMPIIKPDNVISYFRNEYEVLYSKYVPPLTMDSLPQTWLETLTGVLPPLSIIPKFYYQSSTDGFYSFYVDLYDNSYFLPDWLSEWLQLSFNIYLDTRNLEDIQEGVFVFLLIYLNFVTLRVTLFWFITINPFTRPWVYLTSLIDWSFDLTAGLTPGVFGIDVGLLIYLSLLGKLLDFINGLIFTMPFLPSEGEIDILKYDPGLLYNPMNPDIDFLLDPDKDKPVMFFRYLPQLWYTHPIPNEIREYWFYQRPDILKYMIDNYEQLGVKVYPDNILKFFEQEGIPTTLTQDVATLGVTHIHKMESILTTVFMLNDLPIN